MASLFQRALTLSLSILEERSTAIMTAQKQRVLDNTGHLRSFWVTIGHKQLTFGPLAELLQNFALEKSSLRHMKTTSS
jgi:hypothetical protein